MIQDSQPDPLTPQNTISIKEAAKELGVSRYAVRRWIGSGTCVSGRTVVLRSLQVAGRFRIAREALTEFILACNLGTDWKAHEAAEKALDRKLGPRRKAG